MARKFVKHTGILQRAISDEDEVDLAYRSISNLLEQLKFSTAGASPMSCCAGLVFVCPSLIPQSVARKFLSEAKARDEQPSRVAYRLSKSLENQFDGFAPRKVVGMNGFCSGYAKGLQYLQNKMLPQIRLDRDEFVLVITSSRISRITNYGCRQSGALFGDFATATLLARVDCPRFPVQFELMDARFCKKTVSRSFFGFEKCENVSCPAGESDRKAEDRVAFHLDGMGIADTAPRAMAAAATEMLEENHLDAQEVDCVVPHQAGQGIVRLTNMKLEEIGVRVEAVNGLTELTGNISSGSVPYAIQQNWGNLHGNILCPVAAVGAPGKAEVSQGCVFLRAPRKVAVRAAA